jgi:uncharacterized membrane-anchored protein YitT (DUF2179 family)
MNLKEFEKTRRGGRLRDYSLIAGGSLVAGLAYPLFLIPNSIAPGGLTGAAILLNYLFGLPVGAISLLMNLPLFVLCYRSMGREFALRSLAATIFFSLMIDLFKLQPLTRDTLLGAVYGGVMLGLGLGLILRGGATTGGTDMAARMIHKRFPFLSVGVFLFALDCMVILAAGATIKAESALYALICIFVSARIMDLVLAGFGTDKACFVVSAQAGVIAARVLHEMDRGATLLDARGAYSGSSRGMVVSVVSRTEVARVKKIVREEDPRAFMFITDTHETLGEGFGSLNSDRQ